MPPSKFRAGHQRRRRAADRRSATPPTPIPRERQLFKNIIYIGALAALLDIDPAGDRAAARPNSIKGKDKLLQAPTSSAFRMGTRLGARSTCRMPIGLTVRRADNVGDRIFFEGNAAAALGCRLRRRDRLRLVSHHALLLGGRGLPRATAPSFRVDPETGRSNYAIVQAEDELASIGMVIGAGWNGARAFTATSGPGISLMTGIHRARLLRRNSGDDHRRAARRPVHRHAHPHPAGRPASPAPMPSHGDTKHVLLLPEDPAECFEFIGAGARPGRPTADAGLRDDSTSTSA
jgi:2-oxoglutarate ferredoxin oxidoreductase subunit alpha